MKTQSSLDCKSVNETLPITNHCHTADNGMVEEGKNIADVTNSEEDRRGPVTLSSSVVFNCDGRLRVDTARRTYPVAMTLISKDMEETKGILAWNDRPTDVFVATTAMCFGEDDCWPPSLLSGWHL